MWPMPKKHDVAGFFTPKTSSKAEHQLNKLSKTNPSGSLMEQMKKKPSLSVASESKRKRSREKFERMVHRAQVRNLYREMTRNFYRYRKPASSARASEAQARRNELFSSQVTRNRELTAKSQAKQLDSFNRTANKHNLHSDSNKIYSKEARMHNNERAVGTEKIAILQKSIGFSADKVPIFNLRSREMLLGAA